MNDELLEIIHRVTKRLTSLNKEELLELYNNHTPGDISQLLMDSNFCLAGQDEGESFHLFDYEGESEFHDKFLNSSGNRIIGIEFSVTNYNIKRSKSFDILNKNFLFGFDFNNINCNFKNIIYYNIENSRFLIKNVHSQVFDKNDSTSFFSICENQNEEDGTWEWVA